ncbi:MAG: hypothetical protein ACYC0V_21720 [Armatimonadota bacterium]
MALEVGKVDIVYVQRSDGVAYSFVAYMAFNIDRIGNSCAPRIYSREDMDGFADTFFDRRHINEQQMEEVIEWIISLPWNKHGFIALVFNRQGGH